VFAVMPRLLERAGNSDTGSITGIYTVLVDGDDLTEIVTDVARGILDGHIVLNRKIANRNHYPAIDVLASVSRVMPDVTVTEHREAANEIKKIMAVYRDAEDLINIGAYQKGSSADIDNAINRNPAVNRFLTQSVSEKFEYDDVINQLYGILN
jgi:flagellum-specific ATP synthase